MTGRMKTTAAVFGGAALVASGAYALGAQTGGGNAEAAKSRSAQTAGYGYGPGPAGMRGSRPDPFAGLASKLGVSAAKLRAALEALRTDESRDEREAAFAAALAKALGKSEADVKDALAKLRQAREDEHQQRFDAMIAAVAKALGKSEADVKAAFEKNKPADRDGDSDGDGPHGPGPFGGPGGRGHHGGPGAPAALSAIAKDLGVGTAKLRAALMKARPQDPPRREERGDRGADLAKALGVTTDELEKALDEVRTAERDAFAAKLADKLGIDAQKVEDALANGFPFFHGPGGGRYHR